MITFEEAFEIVQNAAKLTLKTERVHFIDSLGRILAEDIFSDINMPPFDKSAMDGFACRKQDIGNELKIIEVLPAGSIPKKNVGKNQCVKIMTGAIIPEGADCVLMVEYTDETPDGNVWYTKKSTNTNICYYAEDIKKGELVLSKDIEIKPQHIAVMASVGAVQPLVSMKPRIGIISTGNELVEPDLIPSSSQIRNSNGAQLAAQVVRAGAIPNYYGIAVDTREATFSVITQALNENDVVLLTGGVSMGDFDFVPEIMIETGVDIKFRSIAVQPGKPTIFGTFQNTTYIFGLPGNPVSSYTQFELLVRPFISRLMNNSHLPKTIKIPMGGEYRRRKSERKSFIPVTISSDGKVYPVEYHGSAHIHSYVFADGIVSIEIGKEKLEIGELVDVRQI
ncbi:MAG: molybdopterin molybdenumtransferase MoeA [Bacteroidetes bacterium CG18_big_fil_WC_8_21_14_2_50_41_14]|nr:MAG: molybdopterin molybdenumtransferase MoeA [Bacteroidetes bacterium CG18_big_fil_WC_8_21_14_2_50_41_14]PIY34344.1 MAG: molybdopterin molybdenumtransferase MoeA [Bacteroidetes bacterium CG_4_10_14_3_um_filter_42_6]PJB59292.1 MAG: molybdopterin molybdenumtransferase MoeA [Bacteroidetes bacterium CG_4_9_14_3_um_filter_41_19]